MWRAWSASGKALILWPLLVLKMWMEEVGLLSRHG